MGKDVAAIEEQTERHQELEDLVESSDNEIDEQTEEQDFLDAFSEEYSDDASELKENTEPKIESVSADSDQEQNVGKESDGDSATQPEPEIQDVDRFQQLEDKLSQRMRNIEGHFGGLKSELLNALKDARKDAHSQGDDAPTAKDIKEAAQSSEKLEALKSDFPEWSEALDEQMNVLEKRISGKVDPDAIQQNLTQTMDAALNETVAQVREIVRVDAAFPGWEDTVNSQEFDDWTRSQPLEVQGLIQSPRASDAIRMLKMFDERNGKPDAAPEADTSKRDEKRKARLEAAVTPTKGGQRAAARQPTEEEEFIKAFNS